LPQLESHFCRRSLTKRASAGILGEQLQSQKQHSRHNFLMPVAAAYALPN
jgi:hypothetical protein